jgi:hypothetical protein
MAALNGQGQRRDTAMQIKLTAEAIARYERISQSPFAGDVHYAVYPVPVAKDNGVFKHDDDYMPCRGCQPDPFGGDELWSHVHLITVGSNGGLRCDPYSSLDALLNDLRDRVRLDCLTNDDGTVVAVALTGADGCVVPPVPVSAEAGRRLTMSPNDLEALIEAGALFDDHADDEA